MTIAGDGDFTILSKTGITDVYASPIVGNVGTSPITGGSSSCHLWRSHRKSLCRGRYQVILTDLMMPRLDGVGFVQELTALDQTLNGRPWFSS